jgi:Nitrogen permease regulator 2
VSPSIDHDPSIPSPTDKNWEKKSTEVVEYSCFSNAMPLQSHQEEDEAHHRQKGKKEMTVEQRKDGVFDAVATVDDGRKEDRVGDVGATSLSSSTRSNTNINTTDEQQPTTTTSTKLQSAKQQQQLLDIGKLISRSTATNPTDEIITPKVPSKCPLFCVFYAVFDIQVGPTVAYQCPSNFMDQTIDISTNQIHDILAQTFEEIKVQHVFEQQQQQQWQEKEKTENNGVGPQKCDGKSNNNSNNHLVKKSDEKDNDKTQQKQPDSKVDVFSSSNDDCVNDNKNKVDDRRDEATGTSAAGAGAANAGPGAGGTSKESIFDSTSEYIITGSELTGKVITMSTHAMHVMTRPTQIVNEKYQRNSLLFSIGFVLRRAADPRPFRPLISKLAMTLRSMEIESGVLSNPKLSKRTIQPLLERILMSLNSPRFECNLVLDRATALNLKLFHPPKPQTSKVDDHQVPVLLRRDKQLQQYEWDLAINWVILHIDGVTNARQISIKAEVDLEMVLACLRVLKHHGVIAVVDMFMYSNRYEFTDRATAMLAGQERKLSQEAVEYCMKQPTIHIVSPPAHKAASAMALANPPTFKAIHTSSSTAGVSDSGNNSSPKSPSLGSPLLFHQNAATLIASSNNISPSSSYPNRGMTLLGSAGAGSHRSSNVRYAMMAENSLGRDSAAYLAPSAANVANTTAAVQSKEGRQLTSALAELYCACSRNMTFGDLWLKLTMNLPTSLVVPESQQQQQTMGQTTSTSRSNFGGGAGAGAGGSSSSTYQRNAGSRKNSLTDYDLAENEAVAFSPLESNLLDALRRGSTSFSATDDKDSTKHRSKTNWNQIFAKFDHRRFFTFGIVHGLLVRVHDYPYFAGPFPTKRASTINFNHSSSSSLIQQNSYSLNSASAMASFSESIRKQKKMMKEESMEEKRFEMAKTVASMMDGTRCDDELTCLFERPFKQLVEMVEKYSGGKKVIHIYATASEHE